MLRLDRFKLCYSVSSSKKILVEFRVGRNSFVLYPPQTLYHFLIAKLFLVFCQIVFSVETVKDKHKQTSFCLLFRLSCAECQWAVERAAAVCSWTWLRAQISDFSASSKTADRYLQATLFCPGNFSLLLTGYFFIKMLFSL